MSKHDEARRRGHRRAQEGQAGQPTDPTDSASRHARQYKLGRAALALAKQGLAVFPCRPRDKVPLVRRGLKEATTDPDIIEGWWQAAPEANIGLATGRVSGVWVLDVDGEDGEDALDQLERQHGELPPTVESRTGRGRHIFFRLPKEGEVRNTAGKIAPGLDTRGTGGYVLVPPSVHPSGRRYVWDVERASRFARAPDWLLARLGPRLAAAGPIDRSAPAEWRRLLIGGAQQGQRNDAIARIAGHLLRKGVEPHVVLSLMEAWGMVKCHPPLDPDEVAHTVKSILTAELQRRGAGHGS